MSAGSRLSASRESAPAIGSGDPIWRVAFSIYYFLAGGYGLTAVVTYNAIRGQVQVQESSEMGAFLTMVLGFAAMFGSILRQIWGESDSVRKRLVVDIIAGVTTITFIAGMLIYAGAIYADVLEGQIMRLPAVLFPIVVGWFPIVAMIALVRTARRRG